jgi:hypothetical protein
MTLSPGAALCAYTHGLGDARRVRQAFRHLVTDPMPEAAEFAELVIRAMIGGDAPDDDVCAAVVRTT